MRSPSTQSPPNADSAPSVRVSRDPDLTRLELQGRLDVRSTGRLWARLERELSDLGGGAVEVDASGVADCDGAGLALLVWLRDRAGAGTGAITGLRPEFTELLSQFDGFSGMDSGRVRGVKAHLPEEVGRSAAGLVRDLRGLVSFVGELGAALVHAVSHPRRMRWRDILVLAERAGVNAMPIVALVSFLMGLILAFQSAIPMQRFGADLYVADLVALSLFRELGPLMTAIILAGRSGSAFAAEIGTMTINEEVNALTTMGLDPVRFLVVARVVAGVTVTPLLTIFANFVGLVGGWVVFSSLGFPFVTYYKEVTSILDLSDVMGGLGKSVAFGFLISAIGCLRGLQTRSGASAVGESTTRAVVSGIVLIVVADGIFSVVYYYLGI